jgi:diguanylate cyclase (GGDEF)-like protein
MPAALAAPLHDRGEVLAVGDGKDPGGGTGGALKQVFAGGEASMRDFVSTRVVRVAGLVASMTVLWTVFIPDAFPWRSLGWLSLPILGVLLLRERSPRSIQRLRALLRSMPKARSYPLLGAALALGAPVGLLLTSALAAGRVPTPSWAQAEITRFSVTYAYLTLSSVAALIVLAHWCGRSFDRVLLLSNTDPLTGLLNRRRFGERVAEEAKRGRRYDHASSVLCVDIDRLKVINDSFGHKAGDHALLEIGRILSKNARAIDAVARVGGDEFAVLLPQTSASQTWALSERILTDVAGYRDSRNGRLTVSIGISELSATMNVASDGPLASADAALYRAKAAGGGQAVMAGPETIASWGRSLTLSEASVSSSR